MFAFSAEDGRKLWEAPHPPTGHHSPTDILVAGGLVWCGETAWGRQVGYFWGYDPKTGELKAEFPPDVKAYWFHHRCHRSKATTKYLMPSRTGIEYVDWRAETWDRNHWVRGACVYGVMPCNGLTYAPQHPCACYIETKLNGFNAVAPEAQSPQAPPAEKRLIKGPAYGKADPQSASRQQSTSCYRLAPTRSQAPGLPRSSTPPPSPSASIK